MTGLTKPTKPIAPTPRSDNAELIGMPQAGQPSQPQLRELKDALERKMEELRVTLASIGDAVVTTDTECRVTFLNPVAEKMTGWKGAEAMGQLLERVVNLIDEQTREPAAQPVEIALREGRRTGLSNHAALIGRDGRQMSIEDSAAPIRDASGAVCGAVMVFHDVTEQRKAESALRRNEQLLADFFENAAMGMHWTTAEGTILRANRAELEMLGYAKDEYVGHNIAEVHMDPMVIQEVLRKLSRGEYVQDFEARLRCKGGSIKHVLISCNALWEDGKFIHTRCFTRDITDKKLAEQTRAWLAAVVESSDDAIVTKTLDGIITTWNRGAERLFGYAAYEVIGRPISILIPADRQNEEPEILARLKRGERIDHYETLRQRKDGTLRNISLTVSPIKDSAGRIMGASKIARDITEQRRAADTLREAQAQLSRYADDLEKKVNERTIELRHTIAELEAFSYSISHDLRAPLRAMQSFSTILAEEYGPKLGSQGQEYIRRIISAAERMDRLIRDVLNYSRIIRADLPLVPVNLDKLLRDILESYPSFHAPAAQIVLDGRFPSVMGNEAVLTQCISNLLGNAVKFVAPGVTPHVRVWSEPVSDGRVRLFFKDNGVGIPEDAHEKIFGIFERISNDYEGTGIGLAIVRKGVERMGGAVGLQSKPGAGSTFWIELTLAHSKTA